MNSETKHRLTAAHFALYSYLRGRDWKRGLTSVTSPSKLNNGCAATSPFVRVKDSLWGFDVQDFIAILAGTVDAAAVAAGVEAIRHG